MTTDQLKSYITVNKDTYGGLNQDNSLEIDIYV